ncbi:zinc finger domain-containing protein [Streptomyces griseofuscus]
MTDPHQLPTADADDVERHLCPRCAAAPESPCRSRAGAVAGTYHTGRFTKVPRLAKLLRVQTTADPGPGQSWRPGTPPIRPHPHRNAPWNSPQDRGRCDAVLRLGAATSCSDPVPNASLAAQPSGARVRGRPFAGVPRYRADPGGRPARVLPSPAGRGTATSGSCPRDPHPRCGRLRG